MKIAYSLLIGLFVIISCKQQNTPKKFDAKLTSQLYSQLITNFKSAIGFKESHLTELLTDISIPELKQGKSVEKKMLFEDFQCECYDQMKLSYSNTDNRFILHVYEEFFNKKLDWCPESSSTYSFEILENKISDLKLDFSAD